KLICRPFGNCEPCPDNALHEPFCEPFGNRRLMHCVPASSNSSSSDSSTSSSHTPPHTSSRDFSNHAPPPRQQSPSSSSSPPPSSHSNSNKLPSSSSSNPHKDLEGETPAWESCGRLTSVERADFWEFVLCNFVFCVLALGMVGVRGKRMKAVQARMLAARIGLVRGGGGR
ncbi:uncharacterized protein STEHIDRAFT_65361, partial [Stereum hirsutum FP-91666 SS1]|uniref:uncharacterized protein n=1 Tax=Stereum hirsutum (strain FP-91666) TaxID=721885 RepID=UPI0004449BBF